MSQSLGDGRSEYDPQIGDIVRVTYLGETKEFTLLYSYSSSGMDRETYCSFDPDGDLPAPTEYGIVLFNGYVGSTTKKFTVSYFHSFDIADGSINPITIEYCRK